MPHPPATRRSVRDQKLPRFPRTRPDDVGRTVQSPHAKAPPFRELPSRYPVEHLAEALVEGIVVGHGDMPEFLFEPDDVEATLAYMASLER